MNLDTPFTKIKSKWITDLTVKCKTIKLLEDDIGENTDDPGFSNDFFSYNTKGTIHKRKS